MRQISLIKEIQEDAIRFGNEANLSRAIPSVYDGLKPSQRYTLYIAYEKGYFSNKPHVKSLKLDGQIVGEAWPHGSEYSTIVRLCQPFVQNIPLIDMHGSCGSQLGTNDAAASRYTEVRLSKACEDGLFKNIDKATCDWIPNYSEDKMLPKLLPAIMPVLYCLGSDGLGYCYSQTWLPGNLNEFVNKVKDYLEGKKLTFTDIYPDFPTKGTIINKSNIHTIYETGQGTAILRGKAEIEDNTIIISELPYQVYVSEYMEQLKSLIGPDKKGITKITGVSNVFNMSGDAGMHIEIECDDDPNVVLNKLYKYSNLQVSLSANQYAIIDGLPELVNLEKYIKVYVDHNIECLKREYKFDLDKAEARKEIVDGLVRAISIIDDIIKTIKAAKSSESAKQDLISTFNFTENQAKAIVDMRLGKLANLEIVELNKELDELVKTIDKCNKFLASDKLQKKEFINRLEAFTTAYGWERRTQVIDICLETEKQLLKNSSTMPTEEYMICLTKGNNLKKIAVSNYKSQTKVLSENDKIISAIKLNNKERFVLISASGQMYKLQVNKLDLCNMNSSGTSVNNFINDEIIDIYREDEDKEFLILITKNGIIKKQDAKTVLTLSKVIGAPICKLNDNDKIIYSSLVNSGASIKYTIGAKEKEIKIDELISKGRQSGGIQGINLTKKLNTFEIKKEA